MNKSDLIDKISRATGDTKTASGRHLDAVIEAITSSIAQGENVTLVGFGTFRWGQRSARKGVNPHTRTSIAIPAVKVIRFVPGQALKSAVPSD